MSGRVGPRIARKPRHHHVGLAGASEHHRARDRVAGGGRIVLPRDARGHVGVGPGRRIESVAGEHGRHRPRPARRHDGHIAAGAVGDGIAREPGHQDPGERRPAGRDAARDRVACSRVGADREGQLPGRGLLGHAGVLDPHGEGERPGRGRPSPDLAPGVHRQAGRERARLQAYVIERPPSGNGQIGAVIHGQLPVRQGGRIDGQGRPGGQDGVGRGGRLPRRHAHRVGGRVIGPVVVVLLGQAEIGGVRQEQDLGLSGRQAPESVVPVVVG